MWDIASTCALQLSGCFIVRPSSSEQVPNADLNASSLICYRIFASVIAVVLVWIFAPLYPGNAAIAYVFSFARRAAHLTSFLPGHFSGSLVPLAALAPLASFCTCAVKCAHARSTRIRTQTASASRSCSTTVPATAPRLAQYPAPVWLKRSWLRRGRAGQAPTDTAQDPASQANLPDPEAAAQDLALQAGAEDIVLDQAWRLVQFQDDPVWQAVQGASWTRRHHRQLHARAYRHCR